MGFLAPSAPAAPAPPPPPPNPPTYASPINQQIGSAAAQAARNAVGAGFASTIGTSPLGAGTPNVTKPTLGS